jgi:hypothetical protein
MKKRLGSKKLKEGSPASKKGGLTASESRKVCAQKTIIFLYLTINIASSHHDLSNTLDENVRRMNWMPY